ncbi:D-aminoacylase [Micromonospora sp. B11E3]|uniref:N-acyl-D-amino-acid deacylase family protein n=1 Tax=Micromonospora sp. B11E3 TaxID=3153562 RepID=UPI00325F2AA4
MRADLVIRGADIEDGDQPSRAADVAVTDGVITAVAPSLPVDACGEEIDGSGLLLCPGFIDMHAHSALRVFHDPLQHPKLAQGFTTELICPDGLGPAPLRPAGATDRRRYLTALEGPGPDNWDWESLGDFLDAVADQRPATNIVTCVPHSAVRDVVMGGGNRQADSREIAAMCAEVRTALAAGARALSFGLIYAPGLYADTAELIALAEVAAEYGAPLVPHVRNEAAGVLDSINEFIRVSELTGAPLHVSHLKLVGSPDLLEDLVGLMVDATRRIDVSFDHYPYGAGSTLLSALLPPWAADGGPAAILRRVHDQGERLRMVRDMENGLTGWENLYGACGPEGITVTDAAAPRQDTVGRTLAEIALAENLDPAVAVLDLLRDTQLAVGMIDHYASETTVRTLFAAPRGMVGSDGIFNPHPHPRLYGTAPRVLGRYVRDGVVARREAVARLTSRAADRLGLDDRGRIAEGKRADLVLLDPATFVDSATYEDPHRTPDGVRRVIVGGGTVIRDGEHTGLRAGVVTRTARSSAIPGY